MVFEYFKTLGIDEQKTLHEEKTVRNQLFTHSISRTIVV